MTRVLQVFVQALLASVALAAPGLEKKSPCKRGACNADNCLRAVRATALPRPSNASADCASFMRKTVSPCPTTTTVTATGIVTAPASTLTVSQLAQVVSTAVQTDLLTSITTITSVVDYTVTNIATVPSTATVTVTAPAVARREVQAVSPVSDASATCPATAGASAVPAYASACSGTARYSSACSCFGVTANTVTAAQSTATATVTAFATFTPTVTVTAQQTQFSVLTVVQTQVLSKTAITYVGHAARTVAITVRPPVTVTTTVTPTTACTTFAPYATNGAFAGHAVRRNGAGIVVFSPDMSNPQLLTIGQDGYLRNPVSPKLALAYRNPTKSVLVFLDPTDPNLSAWTPLKCRVGDPLNQSGIFPLYCDGRTFETCPNDDALYTVSSITDGCEVADLGVFKACTTPYT